MADLAPQDIARRTFGVARRGYEQQEVRGFLHEVSALVDRLTRTETELRERLHRAEAKLGKDDEPDEARLLEVLGEETTRVLTSARDAAAEIRAKSEAAAEQIIAAATSEASELRAGAVREADELRATAKSDSDALLEEARTELDRRRAEADELVARIRAEGEAQAQRLREEGAAEAARLRADGEAAVEAARAQGREMVGEAQAVRERVLRDLAVRRKRARQQVEKLNAGRERLLQAYEVVRSTIDEATSELHVSLSDARLAAEAAARRIEEEPEPTLEQLDEEVATAGLIDLPPIELDHDDDHDDDSPGPFSGEVPAVAVVAERGAPAATTTPEETEETDETDETESVAHAATEVDADDGPGLDEPRPPLRLDDRRGRKGRRKKGFEGLPPAELTVLEPPRPGEGIRILADEAPGPEVEADGAAGSSDEEPAAPDADAAPVADAPVDHVEAEAEVDPHGEEGGDGAEAAATEPGPDAVVEVEEPEAAPTEAAPTEAETADADGPVEDGATEDDQASTSTAADVFARLRADQEQAEVVDDGGEAAPEVDAPEDGQVAADETTSTAAAADTEAEVATEADAEPPAGSGAFAARAEALPAVERELGRRLKRTLADEQNEVLDLLRRAKPSGVDDLLPSVDDHAARWAEAAGEPLGDANAAGAAWSGGTASSVADLADELARDLTAPLRDRIDRSFAASDGNLDDVADRVRALYREWKGQRLTEATSHFTAAAYARGVFDAIPSGSKVRWVVDPSAGPCPDCDDNVLAGAIAKGEEFATGSPTAPAHPGCHCLVLPADD